MDCKRVRAELTRQFDDGEPLCRGLERHLKSCAGCRALADELRAINASLDAIPLEPAKDSFEAEVIAGVARRRGARRVREHLILGVLGLVAASFAVPFLVPAAGDLHLWTGEIRRVLPSGHIPELHMPAGAMMAQAYAAMQDFARLDGVTWPANWWRVASLAAVAGLVIFNVVEARRLLTSVAGGGSNGG